MWVSKILLSSYNRFLFTRRVDPSQKSLSFVSQSVLHAEKVPFATVSFSLAIFQRKFPGPNPPGIPSFAFTGCKVSYYFLLGRKLEIGRFSRTSILDASFMRLTIPWPLQMKLFLRFPSNFYTNTIASLSRDFAQNLRCNFEKSKLNLDTIIVSLEI